MWRVGRGGRLGVRQALWTRWLCAPLCPCTPLPRVPPLPRAPFSAPAGRPSRGLGSAQDDGLRGLKSPLLPRSLP